MLSEVESITLKPSFVESASELTCDVVLLTLWFWPMVIYLDLGWGEGKWGVGGWECRVQDHWRPRLGDKLYETWMFMSVQEKLLISFWLLLTIKALCSCAYFYSHYILSIISDELHLRGSCLKRDRACNIYGEATQMTTAVWGIIRSIV